MLNVTNFGDCLESRSCSQNGNLFSELLSASNILQNGSECWCIRNKNAQIYRIKWVSEHDEISVIFFKIVASFVSSQRLESGTPSPTPLPSGGSARQRKQSLEHVLSSHSFYNSFGSHLDPFIFTMKLMSHIFQDFWWFFWKCCFK